MAKKGPHIEESDQTSPDERGEAGALGTVNRLRKGVLGATLRGEELSGLDLSIQRNYRVVAEEGRKRLEKLAEQRASDARSAEQSQGYSIHRPMQGTGTDGRIEGAWSGTYVDAVDFHQATVGSAGEKNNDHSPDADPPPSVTPESSIQKSDIRGITPHNNLEVTPANSVDGMHWVMSLPEHQRTAILEAQDLLSSQTAENDRRAMAILERARLTSTNYDHVHESQIYGFSVPSETPNKYAPIFAERAGIKKGSVVVEFGGGLGRDPIYFAKLGANVICVDKSGYAVKNLTQYLEDKPYRNRIQIVQADFMDILKNPKLAEITSERFRRENLGCMRQGMLLSEVVTHAYSHSSSHYYTPSMWRNEVLRGYNELITPNRGHFGLAIKTKESASANPRRQFALTENDGYNLRLHRTDLMLRMYPDDSTVETDIDDVFADWEIERATYEGYDMLNEDEDFILVHARAA